MSHIDAARRAALSVAESLRPTPTFVQRSNEWRQAPVLSPEPPVQAQYGAVAIEQGAEVRAEGESEAEDNDGTVRFKFTARYMPFVCSDAKRTRELGIRLQVEVFERWKEFPSAVLLVDYLPDERPQFRFQ